MASKKRPENARLFFNYDADDWVNYRWDHQKEYKNMSLTRFQNYGFSKKAPWIYDLNLSDATAADRYHKSVKNGLDKFWKDTV